MDTHARTSSWQDGFIDLTQEEPAPAPTMRVPTFDQALVFSPFSSIIPPNPYLLPPPLSIPAASATAFTKLEDVNSVRRDLERLSAGAKSAESASQRCQQTLRDVQKLLNPEGLTVYKFKHTKRLKPGTGTEPNARIQPPLSSFATMVFENIKVPYRYPTPESLNGLVLPEPLESRAKPETKPVVESRHPKVMTELSIPRSTPHLTSNEPSQYPTPVRSESDKPHGYVLPVTLTPDQRSEFQRVPDNNHGNDDSITVADRTPKSKPAHPTATARIGLNPKQKGDETLEKLQNLLLAIFQAEDQMQPDTSGHAPVHAHGYFTTHDTEDGSIAVLEPTPQATLDSLLYKASVLGRLDSIEVEQLGRVQRICQNAITAIGSGNLQIGEDWSDSDVNEWMGRVSNAENGLVAARSLVRIMTACSNQKELQSEDYLRSVISANRMIVEGVIIPAVEERPYIGGDSKGDKDSSRNSRFAIASENKRNLQNLIHTNMKCLRLLGTMFLKTDVDESAISSVEDLCRSLIFAENASTEKDSALGMQTFEPMRRIAMDVLALIFTKYIDQRHYILEQILLSLEKLPATKQSARQFRLPDAKPIQLVSALLMRLVQSSATTSKTSARSKGKTAGNDTDHEASDSEDANDDTSDSGNNEEAMAASHKKNGPSKTPDTLAAKAKVLEDSARQYANTVVSTLLRRAVVTSKSSDEPFRKLLDIFTDDFLNVLGSSDWPSAEILLQTLVMRMMSLILNSKSPAPSRTLALEFLGVIGSGILDLQFTTRDASRALDSDDDISRRLKEMSRLLESNDLENANFTAFDGPYRIVIEYLHARSSDDAQLQTARGYLLMQWATDLCDTRERPGEHDGAAFPANVSEVRAKVWNIMQDQHWLEENSDFPTPSTAHGRLAAKIIACNSKLSKAFDRIFDVILSSMNSEQPTIRSRSLKSVTTLLEKDPSVLDRNPRVIAQILGSVTDSSSLVRDSALVLIEKCITLKPDLDTKVYERVISRTTDAATGVRKRAMKLLKQVYVRHLDNRVRSSIANAIISRIQDSEESVAEIARVIIEEIWFSNLREPKRQGHNSLDVTLHYRSHAALVIQTVNIGESVATVLEALIRSLLSSSKQAAENKEVCMKLVCVLFDGIIDGNDIPGNPRQSEVLQTLTVFARASPTLFTGDQLERLEPYAENLTNSDDLDVYRHAITILRHTMPCQTTMNDKFLTKLQTALLSSVAKIPKSELAVVAPCLWTINGLLRNTDRLVNFIRSAIQGVNNHRQKDLSASPQLAARVCKLLTIVGQFGKACDLEPFFSHIKDVSQDYKGKAVSGLMVEVMCYFTGPKQPLNVRAAALESVCAVCQAWPKEFLRADVTNAFEMVFNEGAGTLERVLLAGLEVFFRAQEAPIDGDETVELGSGIASGTQRLGGTYVATDQDGASASISQRFLPQFLRIALASCDTSALDAARIVVSINRQGMAHPRESGPSLIALETCPNPEVAKMAFLEHKQMYNKHESVFEKELMRAVQQAFDYQCRVVRDEFGFTGQPPVSKLHFFWDVLKSGKAKVRTKFFSSICAKLNFDPAKLNVKEAIPEHLRFVRFCVETLAFLEYDRIEELLHLMSCLEKNFATLGTVVAQAIESEVLRIQIEAPVAGFDPVAGLNGLPAPAVPAIEPRRLRQLTTSAQALSLQYETRSFLRRLWNMQKHLAKPKNAAKDTQRAPTRASNAVPMGEAFLRRVDELMTMPDDDIKQRNKCSQFVELISVDNEVRVVSEDDEEEVDNVIDSQSESGSPDVRAKKRKSSMTTDGPRKKARPRKSNSFRLDEDDAEEEWA